MILSTQNCLKYKAYGCVMILFTVNRFKCQLGLEEFNDFVDSKLFEI